MTTPTRSREHNTGRTSGCRRSFPGICCRLLGIQPELGRGFVAGEEKVGSRVVLISHSLWMSQFGGDRTIVGRAIRLSGDTFTVVGVMPASFRFPVDKPQNSLWMTLAVNSDSLKNRGSHSMYIEWADYGLE